MSCPPFFSYKGRPTAKKKDRQRDFPDRLMQRSAWILHLSYKQSKSFQLRISREAVFIASLPNTEMKGCFKNTFSGKLNNLQMENIYSECYTFAEKKKKKLNFDGKKLSKENDK
jgi:hypothetical protein